MIFIGYSICPINKNLIKDEKTNYNHIYQFL